MHYRLTQLLIFGCYIIHFTESVFIFNLTATNKILCYSCKGNDCERISNEDDDNVVVCNKYTQLCWAGFVDQQPYRTCASRYCTPSGISLDSDVRIEMCCHSNLCNNIPLSWSIWRKWYQKPSTRRPETSTTIPVRVTTKRTTIKKDPEPPQIYVVNELDNDRSRLSSQKDSNEEQKDDSSSSKLTFNTSDPATFGINWERVPFNEGFSNRIASINKLLILIIPVLFVLLF